MSDATVKEVTRQEGLSRSYKDYLTAVISFIVGFAVFMYGYGNGDSRTPPMIIGWLIMGWPIFFGVFMTRKFDTLFPSYKVTTTYSDGSKESDHGAESSAAWLIGQVVCFLLSGIIAFFRIVWLTIKTIAYYIGVKEKPSFLLSPFPVLALFLVGFVLAAAIPTRIREAQADAFRLDVPEIVHGTILFAENNPTRIHTEADTESEVVKEVNRGDTLTATGKVTKKRGRDYVPVDHNGTTGWIFRLYARVDMPAIANAIVSAETTVIYGLATAEKNYGRSRLNKGDTVKVIGEEKNGFTPVEAEFHSDNDSEGNPVYRVERGFVKTEDITVQ